MNSKAIMVIEDDGEQFTFRSSIDAPASVGESLSATRLQNIVGAIEAIINEQNEEA